MTETMDADRIEQVRDRLILRGIAGVGRTAMSEAKRRGSIAGFNACRTLLHREDFEACLTALRDQEDARRATASSRRIGEKQSRHQSDDDDEFEYRKIHVELVFDCMRHMWGDLGISPHAELYVTKAVADLVGPPAEHISLD